MPRRVNLNQPPTNDRELTSRSWMDWFSNVFTRVGEGPLLIQGYVVAGLPDTADFGTTSTTNPFSAIIYVVDEVGGTTLAFSDGTDWRRVSDRVIVS